MSVFDFFLFGWIGVDWGGIFRGGGRGGVRGMM